MSKNSEALSKAVVEKSRIDTRLKAWRMACLVMRQIHIEYVNEDTDIALWCERSIYAATLRMRGLIVAQASVTETVAALERACSADDRETRLSVLYRRDYLEKRS